MIKLKQALKKSGLAVGTLAIVIAGAAAFSAFEAHIINVTARIENALNVPVDAIDFGTVFPQEHLEKPLAVSLSQSFLDEDRVDDVSYFIRQKPKCGVTTNGGTVLVGPTGTGHILPNLQTDDPDDFIIDCGPEPRVLVGDETWGLLPSLCEYISKDGSDPDGNVPQNDESLPSFHTPWTFANGVVTWNDTNGHLTKIGGDVVDDWIIDLAVPTFLGFSAQDWEDFVARHNQGAVAADFVLDPADEHKVFGCNLWIEVNGVSETPPPPGTLTVTKVVAGQNFADFSFTVNGGVSVAFEGDGSNDISLPAGSYSVVEDAEAGYTTTYSNSVNGNADCDNLPLASSGAVTCTITNVLEEVQVP
ncbi:MAG: hypothetical protein A3I07_00755 [Candidatus Doudnabacteria bacterium RIFCSPLOWO2_02_FULL_42_9]|uniref:SpaA-like prealbumin fold domain-containing protein n=1 Tax=Candidatus Doudnabacteria bacterium RIFCSPHIGHO2_01_FULL_41_86 TaxID=1817821 RepID=A0A1F5NA35_9BACT|nr:MAG: hypothetical protein A2717_02765 [Candidatus Doudnabacteria bacterium RIFCSPHIGHO2_01_FULL_41_86]OGE75514.1 MAG: hypothetical protein A3K07_01095 [Candidatus Doudnabacteria bacterium RIFCSPHIGHO2_01_43_10]OGE85471.1 MAG: hypothetical protein A3E28_02335 [Candidatus Doudnabacteria bacterium RIFCSPHIGHO2_12_FULL_42_22]OGE87009.1 MAG: hypothetical protein A3C49_03170 [Candidatus Doudnabacteria bacterium RIFCSPHIGHO2_02_FULL_42_25]OGE92608.1 MAG: hypothetical protein A2895_03325 [Candidatus